MDAVGSECARQGSEGNLWKLGLMDCQIGERRGVTRKTRVGIGFIGIQLHKAVDITMFAAMWNSQGRFRRDTRNYEGNC